VAEIELTDSYVSKENYIEFTQDEKDKLSNLANIKSVDGETIVLGEDGKLSAVIPTIEVPVKSIAADDKLLALTETG
jgi:plastocyanin domain-containing protein